MNFNFGGPTTTATSTFGTTTPSTGFSFGSGDAAKPLFGGAANTTDTKPGAFNFTSPTAPGTQAQGNTFGGFAFSPGAKTTAATSSLFTSPTTTNSGQATFGAAKPLGFGGPPNQTVGSPGFGQPMQQAQSTPFAMTSQQSTGPPAFGASQTNQAAAPAFGTPAPASSGFGGFGKPAQTGTPTGFGFSTPASGFSAPAQPTAVASIATSQAPPAFGQTTSFGAKPGSFSFGGAPAATTAAPSFGTPASVPAPAPAPAPAPGAGLSFSANNTGMGFGLSAQPTGGLSFANPTTAAPTLQANSFGQPAQATAQPTSQPGQVGISFSATTQPTTFGQPASQPGMFGSPAATQPTGGMNFGQATSQPTGMTGFGATTPSTGISFGTASTVAPTTTSAVQSTGLNFGAPVSSASVSAAPTFGTPASAASKAPGLFGAPASTAVPTTGLSFGTPSTAPTTGLSFGTTPATSAVPAPTTGLTFGTAPASTAAPGLSFGTATSTGLGFGAKLPTSSAAPTSSAPSGITSLVKSTAATTMPTLTNTTTAPLVPPQQITSISFAELEENINKWTLELEEQEKTFINQATQINAWDKLLIANGEKIVELNEVVQTVKNEQQSLEHELDFVVVQQKELEDLLAPMEKQLENSGDRVRDPEREKMYTLAENLDSQLKQMSEDLKEVIEHLNETNRGQDSNDPIVQIGRILNTHMSSMQWIDNSINQISNKLDQLKATHDTLRRENERSFQLTYN